MPDDLQMLRQRGREIAELAHSIRELAGDDDLAFADTLDGETDALRAASAAVRMVGAMEALQMAAKGLANRYSARAKDFEERGQRARDALAHFMAEIGEKKLVLPEGTLSLAATGQHLVGDPVNPAALPLSLTVTKRHPNREAIWQFLKGGGAVEGCSLSNGRPSLRIRTR